MNKNVLATFVALLVAYVAVLVHEITHVLVSVAATGQLGACPGTGLPISASLRGGVIPMFYACVYPGAPGWNPLIANAVTVIFALGVLWYGRNHWNEGVSLGTLLGGALVWIRYSFYMMGVFYVPIEVNGEIVFELGGDGFGILTEFGIIGMLPGTILFLIGGVIVWRRIRNSDEACSCEVPEGPKNIEYVR